MNNDGKVSVKKIVAVIDSENNGLEAFDLKIQFKDESIAKKFLQDSEWWFHYWLSTYKQLLGFNV